MFFFGTRKNLRMPFDSLRDKSFEAILGLLSCRGQRRFDPARFL